VRDSLNTEKNVVHTASGTVRSRNHMAELAARNLLAGLRTERPPAPVNANELGLSEG